MDSKPADVGQAEFWFASIKIITILALLIVGVVIFFGGAPTHDRLGFRYWHRPSAFKPYVASGNAGKFLSYWTAFVRAGFAFITSPELIALSAGETVAPRRNIPKAAKRFVWRLGRSDVSRLAITLLICDNSAILWLCIPCDRCHSALGRPKTTLRRLECKRQSVCPRHPKRWHRGT